MGMLPMAVCCGSRMGSDSECLHPVGVCPVAGVQFRLDVPAAHAGSVGTPSNQLVLRLELWWCVRDHGHMVLLLLRVSAAAAAPALLLMLSAS